MPPNPAPLSPSHFPPRPAQPAIIGARERIAPARRGTSFRQESRFPHEHDVPRLLARHPVLVFFSAQGRLVERPRFKETLPVGGLAHFLQQIHVVRDLLGAHPARHENARSEEHTSELQSLTNLVCRLL